MLLRTSRRDRQRHASVRVLSSTGRGKQINAGYNVETYNPARDNLSEGSVIEEWIPDDPVGLNRTFRLIYLRDPIAGPAADMFAELPWSDFDLIGITDPAVRKIYEDSLNNLRIPELMPDVTREYLVIGRCALGLIFDETSGLWVDAFAHDPDFLKITPRPFRNADPKLDFKPTEGMRELIESEDERDQDILEQIPDKLKQDILSGDWIPLEPDNTPFIARKASGFDSVGTSFYTRILPAWAMEKQLLTGTAIGLKRRLGGVTLVTTGTEDWEPSPQEMDDIAGMFISADADPVGAVVVLRTGTEVQRLDGNQSMWKIMDEFEFFKDWKTRGLGLSDALLGGEARIESAETARSAFMDRLISLRHRLTQKLLRNRIMLPLAKAHEFMKRTEAELSHRIRIARPDSDSLYELPDVRWHKTLEPVADQQWLDLLERAEEKGLYVPLQMWANAIGVNMQRLMDMANGDAELRKKMSEMKSKSGIGGGDDEGGGFGGGGGGRFGSTETRPDYQGVNDLPIWSRKGLCLGVTPGQLDRDLRRAQAKCGRMLTSSKMTAKKVRSILPKKRAELVLYAMDRLGVSDQQSIDPIVGAALLARVSRYANNTRVASWEASRLTGQADPHHRERVEKAATETAKRQVPPGTVMAVPTPVRDKNGLDVLPAASPATRSLSGYID